MNTVSKVSATIAAVSMTYWVLTATTYNGVWLLAMLSMIALLANAFFIDTPKEQ